MSSVTDKIRNSIVEFTQSRNCYGRHLTPEVTDAQSARTDTDGQRDKETDNKMDANTTIL